MLVQQLHGVRNTLYHNAIESRRLTPVPDGSTRIP
jgi:hypothetical protein